jgi:hypothetical protein
MSNYVVLGKKKLIDLASLQWIKSTNGGECCFRNEPGVEKACDKFKNDTADCASSLFKHCCKHVIRASERERTAFFQAAEIPVDDARLQPVGKIRKSYKDMAEKTIPSKVEFVGLSKSGRSIRMFCSSELNGVVMTDYVQLPPPPKNDQGGTKNSQEYRNYKNKSQLSIVSMYHNDYALEGAWLLHCCHQIYHEHKKEIPDMRVDPVFSFADGEGVTREYKVQFPLSNAAMEYAGFFYDPVPADPTLGAVAYFVSHKLAYMLKDIWGIKQEIKELWPSAFADLDAQAKTIRRRKYNLLQDSCHSKVYGKIVYSLSSYGWYAGFRYISQVMKEPLQWKIGLGKGMFFALDGDLWNGLHDDEDAILLLYILLAERFQLDDLLGARRTGMARFSNA